MTRERFLNTLSLLGLIWTKRTRLRRGIPGDSHAAQLATQYRFLREDAEADVRDAERSYRDIADYKARRWPD